MILECKGLKFECRENTSDAKSVREILERRAYRRREFFPEPGDVWADMGGYIGVFGIWAASLGAKVKAYEPDPDSFEIYRRNIILNKMAGGIELRNCAVTPRGNEVRNLQQHARGNHWRNSLVKTATAKTFIEVECLSVEEAIKGCNACKMDVEGSEFELLANPSWLSECDKFVYEHSFDIEPSFAAHRAITESLLVLFRHVKAPKLRDGFDSWQPSWFPPCANTFAYNKISSNKKEG